MSPPPQSMLNTACQHEVMDPTMGSSSPNLGNGLRSPPTHSAGSKDPVLRLMPL